MTPEVDNCHDEHNGVEAEQDGHWTVDVVRGSWKAKEQSFTFEQIVMGHCFNEFFRNKSAP